jgi:hypothetical protein
VAGSGSGSRDGAPEVEIGEAPSAALGEVIVATLQGEGIRAQLAGTRILVPAAVQTKAREILDFLRSELSKGAR